MASKKKTSPRATREKMASKKKTSPRATREWWKDPLYVPVKYVPDAEDSTTGRILSNDGSLNLVDCVSQHVAEFIVRAVNTHDESQKAKRG